MAKVLVCETMLKPQLITVLSSKGDTTYTVIPSTIFNDAACDCPGFRFRGECKHVKEYDERRCHWFSSDQDLIDKDELECPDCQSQVILFETEPEYA